MICPTDGTVLQLADRTGIEIDYCPSCRGVWLDRGELDKIIERTDGVASARDQHRPGPRDDHDDRRRDDHDDRRRDERFVAYDDDDDDRYERSSHGRSGGRKRNGLLGELFDFG